MRILSKHAALALALAATGFFICPPVSRAADHGDGPRVANHGGIDLGDFYAFVDPNDSDQVVLITTVHGFIVPGEATSLASFDPLAQFTFRIENTGDATPDITIGITFDPRVLGPNGFSQNASIRIDSLRGSFTAAVTQATENPAPNPQILTELSNAKNPPTGIQFFAGEVDDPFFFDLVGFKRFVAGDSNGAGNLDRGRDTFAGYNILAIAMSVPKALLLGTAGATIGVSSTAEVPKLVKFGNAGLKGIGDFTQSDRVGVPGINALIVPFPRKDEYNAATTKDDAQGVFANDIIAVLTALGTPAGNIDFLAGLAITRGDQLRLDTSVANAGSGGGAGEGGFPNGRRLRDDVIDTFLALVTGGAATGDNVPANDLAFGNAFPFLALPQQPRAAGVTDDNTRN